MQVMEHRSERALGSICEIMLVGDAASLDVRFGALWRDILLFEKRFSRFLASSELSAVNARAGLQTGISPAMHALLVAAKSIATATDDRYNPFILPALQRAGYVGSRVPGDVQDAPDYRARQVVASNAMKLTKTTVTIPHNSALDLGGIGKGYLAAQLRTHAALHGLTGYWISLGGDVIGGGVDANDMPWNIAVSNGKDVVAQLTFPNETFSVASSGVRLHTGDGWHHIIDSTTGGPVTQPFISATIVHPSPLWADVLASLAIHPATTDEELADFGAVGTLRTGENGDMIATGVCRQEVAA